MTTRQRAGSCPPKGRDHSPAGDERLTAWCLRLAETLPAQDDPQRLAHALLSSLESLVPIEFSYLTGYSGKLLATFPPDAHPPLHSILRHAEHFAASSGSPEEGCFALFRAISSSNEQSVALRDSILGDEYADEVNHIVRVPSGGSLIVAALRTKAQGAFSDEEIAIHQAIHPLVAFFSRKIHQLSESAGDLGTQMLDKRIVTALEQFGAGLLTGRERHVIKLALLGYSTQTTADHLSISRETAKLHRKHAYAKLRISSQGELFSEFLEWFRTHQGDAEYE